MSPIAAKARKSPPAKRELEALLGRAAGHWAALHATLTDACGPLAEKWTYSATAERWSVRLQQQKKGRTVVYLAPCKGHFLASFALGEKACTAAREAGLPAGVLEVIDAAPRYPEGRGVRLTVRSRRDAEAVARLAAIKLAH